MRLLLALLALAAVAPGTAVAKPCQRPHTRTVAHNSLARVFERSGGVTSSYDKQLLGCLRARDRTVWLAQASDDDDYITDAYGDVTLRRRFAAWSTKYTDVSCKADCPPDYEPTTYAVEVRDLRRPTGRAASVGGVPSVLLLSRRGALVWSARGELHALDSHGDRLLDSGGYDRASVAIHGDAVSWTHGGETRSATLGHY